jgi:hypothetical protein
VPAQSDGTNVGRIGNRAVVVVAALLGAVAMPCALPAAGMAARTYSSPGYRWNKKLPKVAPVIPGKLIKLGDGAYPHVLVDAAGTGQIAYTTEPEDAASTLHDCVLMRGQAGCAANSGLIPNEPGADPRYNTDDDGPTPLAIGNQLLMLTHRYPISEPLPDGTTGYPTFLYTSEDGGKSFTGPGEIGNLGVSGNAVVFGGNNPQIGIISDTETGGTFFQASPPGAYTSNRVVLGDQGPDEAYNGRLAVDGTLPVAEFSDLENHIFIREYNGTGNIFDTNSWSRAEIDGQGYSRLVGGPSGVWLLYQKTYSGSLFVQRIVHGQPSGAASQVTPNSDFQHAYYAITEGADGRLTVGWFGGAGRLASLFTQSSADGRHWSAPQLIAKGLDDPSYMTLAAAGDGGGFAAFETPEPNGVSRSQIDVASFGSAAATGLKGLGNLTGDGIGGLGGDPNGSTSCTDVHFGAIDAIAEAGCFLRDPKNPTSGAAIISGEIRLNGLEIIPNAGVQIVIDPRLHTINTTGTVRVVLRAPGIGDITLYEGSLNLNLSGSLADAGQVLFDPAVSKLTSSLQGFPFDGNIDVKLSKDGVVIPVSLKLPDYMGGVTGQATLLANNTDGLELTSLHIGVDDLDLGALEIKDLAITYTRSGNMWNGMATLNIPAGSPYFGIHAEVEFDDGQFTMGSFHVGPVYPGAPIFTDAFLNGFGGGFDIRPPKKRFFGTIDIGAIPLDPPNYAIGVTGTVAVTFTDNGPVVVEVDGSGSVHGLQIATAKLIFQTNGYFEVDGNLDLDLDVAEYSSSLKAFVDLPGNEFSAELSGGLSVGGYDVASADGIISSKGVGACGKYLVLQVGFTYPWGGSVHPMLESCDFGPLRVQPVSAAAASVRAHAAVASVPVSTGTAVSNISVTGAGGVPSVVLTDPQGHTVIPQTLSPATVHAPAIAAAFAKTNTTVIALRTPHAGDWHLAAAPGSVPITSVASARGYPAPIVKAHITGGGRHRVLHYDVTSRPGLSTTFAEQGGRAYKVIGTARGARGTLRFAPADGRAGRRVIEAIVTESGTPRERVKVAAYTAPGPARPGRVKGLRVAARGRSFRITFGRATSATHYLVRLTGNDGRHQVVLVSHGAHRVTVPALGYEDRMAVSVTGVSSYPRLGPSATASAEYQSAVYRRAHAPKHTAKPRKKK